LTFLALLSTPVVPLAEPLEGQVVGRFNPGSRLVTRAELNRLLEDARAITASPAYSEEVRGQADAYIRLIEERMLYGDFRPGDRIVVTIEDETAPTDTLVVQPGPAVELPTLGPISLQGVLRSELNDHMLAEVGRFIRTPDVTAQALIRITILGAVVAQGSYYLPSNMLLDDAIMAAGGPEGRVDLNRMVITRGAGRTIWQGGPLEQSRMQGLTLDQMALQSGDEITVPQDETLTQNWWAQTIVRAALVAISFTILGVRIF
jgi:hypothetical protein